ncbi:MAG TPA: lamin tail domain-containing protein, partial [Candidatus Krumholzibacteria bacterium]|nr:lamin tail domain-containing protein [Candidatus Krumholzibacteria bacterium]
MTSGGRFLFCMVLACVVSRACAQTVVINELYYDHPGTDTGHEFVELFNAGASPADISDAAIEFHNGTGSTWSLVWRAPPGTVLAPDGLYVVGGELVVPLPDAVITYSLQNGPDAIRLVNADGGVLDTVGYGGLDDPDFVETRGADAVPAGKSIARALDGVDSNNNQIDFVAASPTPGRHN